jgi:hypothetical protein
LVILSDQDHWLYILHLQGYGENRKVIVAAIRLTPDLIIDEIISTIMGCGPQVGGPLECSCSQKASWGDCAVKTALHPLFSVGFLFAVCYSSSAVRTDLARRKRVMQRSIELGHCICDPRRSCPCDVFHDQGICPCAGERPAALDVSQLKLTSLGHNPGCVKIAPGIWTRCWPLAGGSDPA